MRLSINDVFIKYNLALVIFVLQVAINKMRNIAIYLFLKYFISVNVYFISNNVFYAYC